MKRILLKESDLVNLINRVINESKTTSKLKFNKQSRKKGAIIELHKYSYKILSVVCSFVRF